MRYAHLFGFNILFGMVGALGMYPQHILYLMPKYMYDETSHYKLI